MVETVTRYRTDTLYSGENGYDSPHSPMLFGAQNAEARRTLITNEPLVAPQALYRKFIEISQKVSDYMEAYTLYGRAAQIGAEPNYFNQALDLDRKTSRAILPEHILYAGLDVYVDPIEGPKVLEINSSVQAMGLQETRLDLLGVSNQPRTVDHFIDRLHDSGVDRLMVLGSKLNPFWRAHARLSRTVSMSGIDCTYNSIEEFEQIWKDGYHPDAIVKLCSTDNILNLPQSGFMREQVVGNTIPFVNRVSAAFYGYRGFLDLIARDIPELFPGQTALGSEVDEPRMEKFPWIKLEAGKDLAYVVNFNDLRRWGKDALISLIQGKYSDFDRYIGTRDNGDAQALKEVKSNIENKPADQIRWVAQQDVRPLRSSLSYSNRDGDTRDTDLHILHRVYFVRGIDGKVKVSLEAFGCTEEQFSRSKGKVNAGTGIAVPIIIK